MILSVRLQTLSRTAVVTLLIGGFYSPITAFAQETPTKEIETPTVTDEEPVSPWWGHSFDRRSQFILLTGALSTGIASMADHTMRDQWRGHQRFDRNSADFFNFFGTGIPGLAIAAGQTIWDRDNGVSHLKSLVGVTAWTVAVKALGRRQRPNNSPHNNSFPSGHTSTIFATATSLQYAYGWKVGLPAYLIGSATALSRLSVDVHWFSDVVGGAVIGIWMGRAYYHNLESEKSEMENSSTKPITIWMPSFENNTAFIHVLSQF